MEIPTETTPQDRRVRVLVVEDSQFMQRRISAILESASDLRVVGCADSAEEAVLQAELLSPDVITLDINMAKTHGFHAVSHIMGTHPRPIIIVSSYTHKGGRAAMCALGLGVVDIVEKPSAINPNPGWEIDSVAAEIIAKVRTAATVRFTPTTPCPVLLQSVSPVDAEFLGSSRNGGVLLDTPKAIAIGAGAGGPVAIEKLLKSIPHEFFPPILIAQQLPSQFTSSFAQQLDAVSNLNVVEAEHGMPLAHGFAYVAPGGRHMEVRADGRISVSQPSHPRHTFPSMDLLFQSLANQFGPCGMGIVLSGSGTEGVDGALALKKAGAAVVAQNKATCLVFDSPRAVIESGAAGSTLPLDAIASLLTNLGRQINARHSRSPASAVAVEAVMI